MDPGAISVSRRRRVYDFLSATKRTKKESAAALKAAQLQTPIEDGAENSVVITRDVAEVRLDIIARIKKHEADVRNAAVKRAEEWELEMQALRSVAPEPIAVSETDENESPPAAVASYAPFQSIQSGSQFSTAGSGAEMPGTSAASSSTRVEADTGTPATEPLASEAIAAPPQPTPSVSSQPSITSPSVDARPTPTPASPKLGAESVADLYSPPQKPAAEEKDDKFSLGEFVEDLREAVSDVVENVTEFVEDVVEDVTEAIQHDSEETKSEAVQEKASEEDEGDRSIGEVILDAIVEGVPSPETPVVDKSDIIDLVDTGKVKNLTVTKLRRLLAANNLKISGRKAELIARLTSFAKAK